MIFNEEQRIAIHKRLKGIEKSIESHTRLALVHEPRARNSDLWLALAVWELQGLEVYIPNDWITEKKIFQYSSISRTRRKIQNTEGRFLPTKIEVAQARGIKAEVMREYYGAPKHQDLIFVNARDLK